MAEKIRKITVVGAGTMGHGIAEVAALAGYEVWVSDISDEILQNALKKIEWSLKKLYEKGQIKEGIETVMERIHTTTSLEKALENADFVIEAVPERLDLKHQIFSEADKITPTHTILATNTSSLPITEIARATNRPEKVVGMHFFNPPPLMPLVEIIKGEKTSDETVKITFDVAKKFGKQPVLVNKDVPGFIVNRILARVMNNACWLVARKEFSIIEIDSASKYKLGLPMGIFELADYSGIDVFYYVFKAMSERGFKATPCPIFEEKFKENSLGMKTGKGFYKYPEPGKYVRPDIPKEAGEKVDPLIIISPAVNEAAYLIRENIASKEDIDKAVKLGLGYPKGVLEMADELGLDNVLKTLEQLKEKTGYIEYDPDPLLKELVEKGHLGRKTGKGFYEYGEVEEIKKETLILRLEPPIAWIVLNRPNKLNALSQKLLKELDATLDELEENDKIRTVIITGSGRAFSAGADVTSFIGVTPFKAAIFSRRFQQLLFKIEYYTKPVIMALNGFALGGGLELAMSGDFRIASETAMLGQPEINLGIMPGAGGTQRLPRLVGPSKAKELIYTGDMIPANEALKIGLVDKVVPPEKLESETRRFALKLAEKAPLSILASKYSIQFGLESGIWEGMALESAYFGLLFSTDDVVEGISAFMEKRKPKFKGK